MPIQQKCRILDHKKIGPRHYNLTLSSEYIATHALPGQFVNVKVSDELDPLLRRPISFHRINLEQGTFELLYEVIGKGTEILSRKSVNSEVDILGPLGSGFTTDKSKTINIVVAGGMGVAPMLALAKVLTHHPPFRVIALIGAKSKEFVLCEKEFNSLTKETVIATDDGSYGKKGLISDVLLDILDNTLVTGDWGLVTVYACGPKAMLKAISEIVFQKKVDSQLSMEERMACGVGACKGCPVKTRTGYKMVCKDGPVFKAEEIIWN